MFRKPSRISIEHVARVNGATTAFQTVQQATRTQFALGEITQLELLDALSLNATRYSLILREIAGDIQGGAQ